MKFIQFIKNIINEIRNLWNVYGGIILSTVISWWSRWSKATIDVWASYLTLTITCIGLLTFFKIVIMNNKKGKIDGFALSKTAKNVRNALDPLKPGQEVGEAIIYTAKGGKKLMANLKKLLKWLWGNKLTLTSIISNLVVSAFAQFIMYSDTLKDIQFFQEHDLIFKIVVTVLCVLWLADNIFCVVTKYGLENLEELKTKSELKKQEQLNKLSKEQKAVLKQTLAEYKKSENIVLEELKKIDLEIEKFQKIISNYKILEKLGIGVTAEQVSQNNEAKAQVVTLENQKATLENQKNDLSQKIVNLKNQL